MTGVEIIGEQLAASAALLAVVPQANILAGELPQGQPLPALCVNSISLIDGHNLKGRRTLSVERVQVTVFAANYQQQKDVLGLARTACDVEPTDDLTIRTDGAGPDFRSDAPPMWIQTQDFRVSYPA